MSNLFIFAIGGTGARVLRSLGILMASGLKVNADKVIPIIIDTDSQNKDTNRTINLLNCYRDIRNDIPNLKFSFFHNTICTLSDLGRQQGNTIWGNSFYLKLQETTGKSFSDYIDFSFISDYETKCLIELLYSKENLEDSLTHGFLGSPNVGCVVLDSINSTKEFQNFGNLFQPDDRIFIISSIFGGTGAAGFPLLINNFRQNNPYLANSNALQNAIIGAVSVLPYFTLSKNNESRIDSSTFYTKSIAALSYYEENIKNINALYYIGDGSKTSAYDNVEGGDAQKNDANFIEIAAALSIFDFMQTPDSDLKQNTLFKEYAIQKDHEKLDFSDLGKKNNDLIAKLLSTFKLFELFRKDIEGQVGATFTVNNQLDEDFFCGSFYNNLNLFFEDHFNPWLLELSRNTRGFIPFDKATSSDLSNFLTGKQIPKYSFRRPKLTLRTFIKECDQITSDKGNNCEKYIDLMNKAAIKLFDKHLSNFIN